MNLASLYDVARIAIKEQWEAMKNGGPTQMEFDDLDESDSI